MIRSITEPWTYPGVKLFALLAGGILLGDAFLPVPDYTILAPAAVLVLAAGALLIPRITHNPIAKQAILACAVLALGVVLQQHANRAIDGSCIPFAESKTQITVRAVAAGEPEIRPDGWACDIRCLQIADTTGSHRVSGLGRLFFKQGDESIPRRHFPARGDTLVVRGWMRIPQKAAFPGGFDYRDFLNRQGLTVTMHASGNDGVRLLRNNSFSLWKPIHAIRMYVYQTIERYADPQRAGVLIALTLGDRGLLDDPLMETFRTTGIVHILAVSGLHTGIILMMFYVLFMRLPLKWRVPLVIAGLMLYAMLTGLHPPVVRAAVMAILFLSGLLLQRTSQPVNAIAIAGAGILLFDSQAMFTLSFQLSFLASISIALFYSPLENFLKKWTLTERFSALREIRSLVAVTLAAQAGTVPVILTVFGGLSVVSLISNLFAVPLTFYIVVSAVAGLIVHTVVPVAGGWLLAASDAGTSLLIWGSEELARVPYAEIHPGPPPIWGWMVYLALLMYLAFGRTGMRVKIVLGSAAVAVAIAGFILASAFRDWDRGMEIAFLDVGQGDATLITTPGGGAVLIDAGPNFGNTDAGKRVILPYLRSLGISHLDALILTHADADHIGGAESVVAGIDVDTLYYSGISIVKTATRDLDSVIGITGVPVKAVYSGDVIPAADDARFYVLGPERAAFPREADNDASIVILARYGRTSAIFTGDTDTRTERQIAAQYGAFLDADVLKVGHHGSTSSTSERFIGAVTPEFAVISCGRNNRYRHPAPRVGALLEQAHAAVFRTDVDGTVILCSDGKRFSHVRWNR